MARAFFKLKDTGTTFYDVSQAKGLVADRVAELELTENVRKAKSRGIILEVDEAEGKEALAKQEEDYTEAVKAAAQKQKGEVEGEVNLESADAKQAIEGGVANLNVGTMQFNEGDARTAPAGQTSQFNAEQILDGNTQEVTDSLTGLNAEQLNILKATEQSGDNRKGVLSAIENEQSKLKEGGKSGGKSSLSGL